MPFGVGPGVGVAVDDGDGDGAPAFGETRVATMPRTADPKPTTVTSSPTGSAGGIFVDDAMTTIVADELPSRLSEKPSSLDRTICPVTVSDGGGECQIAT